MKAKWKRWINYCLILSLLFILCNGCVTTKPEIIREGVPEGYILIKKDTLGKMLGEMIYQRQQLLECLERERK